MEKKKYELEYVLNISSRLLYNHVSTPEGLQRWFADQVDRNKDNEYTFAWEQSEQKARVLDQKKNEFIRFQWEDSPDSFFEFRLRPDELTNEMALLITDHAEEDEISENTDLWDSQVQDLKRLLGC